MRIFFIFLLFSCISGFSYEVDFKLNAKSAILLDRKTGKVLYAKNAQDRFFPASLTKIATVYYALETISDINQYVTLSETSLKEIQAKEKHKSYSVEPYILENDGTKMYGLFPSKKVLLKDLFYGAMLSSGNNAANAIAEATSGDISLFMDELNAFFKKKGLKSTHFKNPHGLHFPGHYSSAYDLAILTKFAIENPIFREIVKTITYASKDLNYKIKQRNKLLLEDTKYFYPKAFGVKTGFTDKSGYNLIASAEDVNHSFIGVVLGCENSNDRYDDILTLFNAFFSEKNVSEKIFSVNQTFEKELFGAKGIVKVSLLEDLIVNYYPSRQPKLEAFIEWTNVELPIKKGQIVGNLIIKDQEIELTRAPLYSQNDVQKQFFRRFFSSIF
jgi:serine-type D-Ala-D-Ala carboxypeptidase (penicillin-binding protein 5/6)